MQPHYDAILFVSFGGPEGRDEVMPFLENVLRGRNVPRERMLEVAEHYYQYDGVSPLNQQVRDLLDVVQPELRHRRIELPVYWGNRNWHPFLTHTLERMASDGVRRPLAFVLAGYSSYSSCRQYREDIERACEAADPIPGADKIRVFYNHPDFIAANADRVQAALDDLGPQAAEQAHLAFTAHSIPESMARNCDYEQQLLETCRLVADRNAIHADRWQLVYQSRSGRPQDPWLEPDICDHVRTLHANGVQQLVIAPVGFLSDHMEVLFDLDEEARAVCDELGMSMQRAGTVGTHPQFVEMICKLIEERLGVRGRREAIGRFGPSHDVCPVGCCPAPMRPRTTT